MTGLRERQKADRTRRILEAASTQFRAQGYDPVRIEDIAAAADVSAGTCYNYFSTKGDILLAIVSMEVEEVIDAGRAVVADPPADVAIALDRLIRNYYDHSLQYLSKELWRRAVALSVEAPETPFSQRYLALDSRLTEQVSDLVAALQARGQIRRDLDSSVLGGIIFAQLNQAFIEFVKAEAMPLEDLHRINQRATDQLALLMAAR
ncbi:TetR/AcrR family transcriptional regulator [Tabrizicola sp.]|jgi:AcrR family transcriptional regulator|uniref:TetR/AcrR family transcriptional regulator n=1 Tax=Tabrizicola sp. TaxID=2005166 RepID=UPI001A5BF94C|nr:TetR/AcrR family transcriptional regulator [Tabrizicola sp.]MBL9063444.1 TetR/AcrR family transcriptional regulator [Tabrizicola sp.]